MVTSALGKERKQPTTTIISLKKKKWISLTIKVHANDSREMVDGV
jgi:hypothetical protein